MNDADAKKISKRFAVYGEITDARRYGDGHINATYLVTTDKRRYILQRVNTDVFPNLDGLMRNIIAVTSHLKARGAETLGIVPTTDGSPYLADERCRMYDFIENTVTLQRAQTPAQLRAAAAAFGEFVRLLSDFDASALTQTIPKFHDTPDRYSKLAAAVAADKRGRLKHCADEAAFVRARKDTLSYITDGLKDGIPLRVTHNDTKLNNILLDATTGKARAIIDLDTVMPGSLLYDFGDSIRFGASAAREDERDLGRVRFDIDLFSAYADGYLPAVKSTITPREVELLPYSAYLMTLECGMRFLTDYLDGDVYFATAYHEHNLVRCRTQLKLVAEMEKAFPAMRAAVRRALNR